jgi:hypothetical protein
VSGGREVSLEGEVGCCGEGEGVDHCGFGGVVGQIWC